MSQQNIGLPFTFEHGKKQVMPLEFTKQRLDGISEWCRSLQILVFAEHEITRACISSSLVSQGCQTYLARNEEQRADIESGIQLDALCYQAKDGAIMLKMYECDDVVVRVARNMRGCTTRKIFDVADILRRAIDIHRAMHWSR